MRPTCFDNQFQEGRTSTGVKGATSSQVALAWLLAQKPWIVPIPGTTKLERLEENLRSVDLEFSPEEWRDLNHAVSKIKLQGDRYSTDQEKQVGH